VIAELDPLGAGRLPMQLAGDLLQRPADQRREQRQHTPVDAVMGPCLPPKRSRFRTMSGQALESNQRLFHPNGYSAIEAQVVASRSVFRQGSADARSN
jgi:hypothetical protein